MNIRWYIYLTLSASFLMTGCANMPTPSQLTPELNKANFVAINKILTVGDVTGKEQKDVLGIETISVGNDTFKQALIETLKDSGIFKAVSQNPGGDYLLSAQIISQKLEGYGTLTLFVRYRLVENASGKIVWANNIFSEKSISVGEVFMGAERTKQLRQIVFRDNLSKLVVEINKVISQIQGVH